MRPIWNRVAEEDDRDNDLDRHDPPWLKSSHPCMYDPFTIWGKRDDKCNGSFYTDRMWREDDQKYQKLEAKHFTGESERPFDSSCCKGAAIEAFLREWLDDPALKLLRVVEYCNVSTGFPTWRLDFHCSTKDVAHAN